MCYYGRFVRAFAFHHGKKYGFSACLAFQWHIYTLILVHLTYVPGVFLFPLTTPRLAFTLIRVSLDFYISVL